MIPRLRMNGEGERVVLSMLRKKFCVDVVRDFWPISIISDLLQSAQCRGCLLEPFSGSYRVKAKKPPWTSLQPIAGHTYFSLSHSPLGAIQSVNLHVFGTVGGNWSTRRTSTQAWGQHAKSMAPGQTRSQTQVPLVVRQQSPPPRTNPPKYSVTPRFYISSKD